MHTYTHKNLLQITSSRCAGLNSSSSSSPSLRPSEYSPSREVSFFDSFSIHFPPPLWLWPACCAGLILHSWFSLTCSLFACVSMRAYICICICVYIYIYIYIYIFMYTHTYTNLLVATACSSVGALDKSNMYYCTHTYTHTYTHALVLYIYTHTYTSTRTHLLAAHCMLNRSGTRQNRRVVVLAHMSACRCSTPTELSCIDFKSSITEACAIYARPEYACICIGMYVHVLFASSAP